MMMEERLCYSAKKMEPVYFPIRGKTVFMALLCYGYGFPERNIQCV